MDQQLTLYHAVPETLVGDTLVPLNQMSGELLELKQKYLAKYIGRESLLSRKIPKLNCLWNDVLQFLPINPQLIFEEQKKLGIIDRVPPYRFYAFPATVLDQDSAVVLIKRSIGEAAETYVTLPEYIAQADQNVPEETAQYYKSTQAAGEQPFNYQFVPHVLYKGSISVQGLEIVTLHD